MDLEAISERLKTQDNRITADPIFVVQQRNRIWGFDLEYCEDWMWVDEEGNEATQEEYEELKKHGDVGWNKVGYKDTWEFVTACFTEQGCKDYIAYNGHNLTDPRIYAESGWRNAEWIGLRNYLMNLT